MDGLGLINMNARLYDAEIGRFVSPDTVIQAAALSQNYNRYSYVMNNPLKYTDPSGHRFNLFRAVGRIFTGIGRAITRGIRFIGKVITSIGRIIKRYLPTIVTIAVSVAVAFAVGPAGFGILNSQMAIGAVAGAAGGFAGGLASGGGLKAALRGAVFGGLSGAVAGYVAHGFGGASAVGRFGTGNLKNFVHAVSQGAIAKLRGGDFRSGFIGAIVGGYAGKVSNYINGKISALKNISDGAGVAMRTAVAGVIGGISAKITGGRFEDGAVSAAFTWLFNHESGIRRVARKVIKSLQKLTNLSAPISETERILAQNGYREAFWTDRLLRGDPLAATALEIVNDQGVNGKMANRFAAWGGESDLNGLGIDLMNAHIRAVDNDNLGIPYRLSVAQVDSYHHSVFVARGISTGWYGGTLGGLPIPGAFYCPKCDTVP